MLKILANFCLHTAEVTNRFEPIVIEQKTVAVLVVGDVNSTIAYALIEVKQELPVVHIEVGLRRFDREMPEEINRILTDSITEWLFTTERNAWNNLLCEGVADERIHFVGNLMIDTLLTCRDQGETSKNLEKLAITNRQYVVITLHRSSNVDDVYILSGLLSAVQTVGCELPIVFPVHPRTRKAIEVNFDAMSGEFRLVDPLGYLDLLQLTAHAQFVLTDPGGIQEDTIVPVSALPDDARQPERPVTVGQETDTLAGPDPAKLIGALRGCLATSEGRLNRTPEF